MKYEYNINFLRNFVEIVNEGSITGAAGKLYTTQSTLSKQMQTLEKMLDITLFKRIRSGVELTDDGVSFYERCKKLIRAYEEFVSGNAMEFQKTIAGSLNIGQRKMCEEIFLRLNSSFLKEYPYVSIKNTGQLKHNLLDLLMAGELDLVFLYAGELNRSAGNIKSMQVCELDNMVLVSRANPLSARDRIHLSEMKDEKFILPNKKASPCRTAEILSKCENADFVPKVAAYAEGFLDYMLKIAWYDGVAVMPYMPGVDTQLFKFLELEGYPKKYPIHAAWSEENTNPVLQAYITHMKKEIGRADTV